MDKIYLASSEETLYTKTLENGLKVWIIHKPDYIASSCYIGFDFGSISEQLQKDEKGQTFPSGIAHFLEHKLFENNNGTDMLQLFSNLSASVNAFTSHNETVYYFNTSKPNFKPALNRLLDFVFNLSITEASVEKEKGIIIQELRMYKQMPEQQLMMESYQSLFHQHPIRNDIGGDEESVSSITKERLEQCFEANYHPQNATLVCISAQSPEKVLYWIEENQSKKEFSEWKNLTQIDIDEPREVKRSYYTFEMDIQAQKVIYAFKLDCFTQDPLANLRQEWLLRLFCDLHFSSINPQYETWIQQGRIHDYFGYDVDLKKHIGMVMFFAELDDERDFVDLIDAELRLSLENRRHDFELLKKRYHAQMIRILDDFDDYAMLLIRSGFEGLELEEVLMILTSIEFEELEEILACFDFNNTALTKMVPKLV